MNESMIQGQIIRPFSPAIGKYKLSDDTITTLNNHIDEILKFCCLLIYKCIERN